ncbi:MAG: trimethylamine methyltransferase family protein [Candidatus Brocadiia bacterium]
MQKQREGVIVEPEERLSSGQVKTIDGVSRELLEDPGLLCYNQDAAELYEEAGAEIESEDEDCVRVRISPQDLDTALENAPSKVVLGARNPDNRLILDADEPRSRFVSGSETNVWLDVGFDGDTPRLERREGSIERLCHAAHLADNLEHLDSFIRCVNIRDKGVTERNKDVNKLLASLNNITKHVQAGLTSLDALDDVVRMGQIIAGGEKAFRSNPVISFITCVIKSPLQVVEDTAEKLIEIASRRVPVVISSSPMGGTTAPFDEFGMVAQINAEILAGVMLTQLVSPGTPVLYGSVPVRCRLDTLEDMYGAPEFNHYNRDCAQMARFYGLPCYSTANVGDAEEPGIQATAEKMLTLMDVPRSGAQYIHYAFGLLERTNVFCPEQAVLDNAHIGMIKHALSAPDIDEEGRDEVLSTIREVMQTDHKTYMYHLPMPTRQKVYANYPLENEEGGALKAAHEQYHEILESERDQLPPEIITDIKDNVPGVLDSTLDS